ncbi:hypothetical protein BKA69DRAFT_210421 [Paraphysoderma sedebokerense]|nr:hypothetical protein BKA69DRAFT_210421 [Paraphysoderma sedebokerense]
MASLNDNPLGRLTQPRFRLCPFQIQFRISHIKLIAAIIGCLILLSLTYSFLTVSRNPVSHDVSKDHLARPDNTTTPNLPIPTQNSTIDGGNNNNTTDRSDNSDGGLKIPGNESPADGNNGRENSNSTNPDSTEHTRNPLSDTDQRINCKPVGICVLCSDLEKSVESYCKDTGYKEPIICTFLNPTPTFKEDDLPKWRSCVGSGTTASLVWFECVNAVFLAGSWFTINYRRSKIQREQYQRLASRINNV